MTLKQAAREIKKLIPKEYIVVQQDSTITDKGESRDRIGIYAGHVFSWIYSNDSIQDAVNKASEIILNAQTKSQQESSKPEQSSMV